MILPATAIVVVAVAALLIAGSRHLTVRTASADAPNQLTIATLRPGHDVCEGPITSQGTARGVGIWGAAAGTTAAALTVTVKDASTHDALASGVASGDRAGGRVDRSRWTGMCPRAARSRSALRAMSGAFSLAGSTAASQT